MLRGTNDVSLEEHGLTVVKPEVPSRCTDQKCANAGELLKDCTCKCAGGYTGAKCETCGLKCTNGGALEGGCMSCKCPIGRFGDRCEGGYTASTFAIRKVRILSPKPSTQNPDLCHQKGRNFLLASYSHRIAASTRRWTTSCVTSSGARHEYVGCITDFISSWCLLFLLCRCPKP